ncbi:MAG: hypothetical protein IKQ78_05150 [Bacilli bacterium]|nr:hypothetical protein [Bacilli bacterium]
MAKRKIKATTVKPTQQKEKKSSGLWANIKFLFSTLISNDRCIEGGTKKPWYAAICVAIVACIIAVIPTMVSYFTRSGASFFSGQNYSLDTSLTEFEKALHDENVSMKIEGNKLTVNEEDWKKVCKDKDGNQADFYGHYYTVKESKLVTEEGSSEAKPVMKDVTHCDLAVYYVSDAKLAGSSLYNYITTVILAKNDPNTGLNTAETTWSTNLIVFGEETFVAFKQPSGAASYKAAMQGKYDFAEKFDLKNLYSENMKGEAYEHIYGTAAHRDEVIEAYKGFFAASYESTKIALAWQYTGIAFAINVGLVFLYGLLIFLMTRGKKTNPFHVLTFWQTQKISYWESLAPGILSLIGFIPLFANFTMFLFLFLMGARTMWMSTRQLRPQYE